MGSNLSLVVDNRPLSKEDSEKVVKKAVVIGKILVLRNKAEEIRNEYNQKYIDAVMQDKMDELITLTPRITEWGGRIRAYSECLDIILKGGIIN